MYDDLVITEVWDQPLLYPKPCHSLGFQYELTNLLKQGPRAEHEAAIAAACFHAHSFGWGLGGALQQCRSLAYISTRTKMLWARHAQEGAARGMWVHLEFEALLNGHIMSRQSSEIEFFLAFISTLRDCVAYRTDWAVFAEYGTSSMA